MLNAFMQLLQGESPERVVWTADITYWFCRRIAEMLAESSAPRSLGVKK